MTERFRIELRHDGDCENPLEWDLEWKLYSFNRRHANFKSPEKLGLGLTLDDDGWPVVEDRILRGKLKTGLAFFASCHQHSGIQWGLPGEVPQCPWDTARVGGLLVWEHNPVALGKTCGLRASHARIALSQYTAWCNGECYGYEVSQVDEAGSETVHDSCFGFIVADRQAAKHFFEQIGQNIPPGAEIDWSGSAAVLVDRYADIPSWLEGNKKVDATKHD